MSFDEEAKRQISAQLLATFELALHDSWWQPQISAAPSRRTYPGTEYKHMN